MKLLIKEYLAALKERGELDAILPDLLSEMGLHVFSRPAVGVRQNGVDLAAVGEDQDGRKKVFLFTVKPGDLGRNDWNGSIQSVRPSLDEIIDSYIPRRIPKQYADLAVVICICIGGDIEQTADSDVSDYEKRLSAPGREFQRWDGDHLANLMLSAVLGENVISGEARSSFRKAVAMLDEPDAAYQYFTEMLEKLKAGVGARQKDLVTFVRQVNLCCWILYAWSREAENLEAPFRCSELAMLWVWDTTAPYFERSTGPAKSMRLGMASLVRLHVEIINELVINKYLPNTHVRDGLAAAVNSSFALDVNLRLYDALGRIAMGGIWLHYFGCLNQSLTDQERESLEVELARYQNGLINCLNSNGILTTPVTDSQSIEISIVCIFLGIRGRFDAVRDWSWKILNASIFAMQINAAYPCVFRKYSELSEHPKPKADADYFQRATAGSTLIATLFVWLKLAHCSFRFKDQSDFLEENLSHCTFQLWVPNEESERNLYRNSGMHGLAVIGLVISETCDELIQSISKEYRESKENFENLSAIRLGYWPIVLSACRHHRIPVPINFWNQLDAGNQ